MDARGRGHVDPADDLDELWEAERTRGRDESTIGSLFRQAGVALVRG